MEEVERNYGVIDCRFLINIAVSINKKVKEKCIVVHFIFESDGDRGVKGINKIKAFVQVCTKKMKSTKGVNSELIIGFYIQGSS